ncbi:cytochrome b/b6 domain-containing protein [Maridesulfovibrio sp.]|uniref:cytochrome b/b6 domain-containing protein n=1 Tax=Maridesulfovibrio sp. TaxID=2795000 RepID=UPI003AFFCD92
MKKSILYLMTLLMLCALPLQGAWAEGHAAEGADNAPEAVAVIKESAPVFPEELRKDRCLSCHATQDLRPVTERGAGLEILISDHAYDRSVHGNMDCVVCHAPNAKMGDFKDIPHDIKREALPSCMNCHDKSFDHIRTQMGKSVHFQKQGAKITCTDCHNPHTQQKVTEMDSYAGSVAEGNKVCVDCHTSAIRYKELSGRAVYTQNLSHEFLPKRDLHFASVRCVECHTPADSETQVHIILPKEKSLRNCEACHTENESMLITRIKSYTDKQMGGGSYLNKGFFDDKELIGKMLKANINPDDNGPLVTRIVSEDDIVSAFGNTYVPGLGQTSGWDGRANMFLLGVLLLLLIHGTLRVLNRHRNINAGPEVAGEIIYPLTIRIMHWTNAVLFLILMTTGFSIHYPGAALSLPMELSVELHNAVGVLLSIHFVLFLSYLLLSGEIGQYLPLGRKAVDGFWAQMDYYTKGIFQGAEKPHHPSKRQRMNPVQQLTYLLIYCGGMLAMVGSGLCLLVPELAARFLPEATTRGLASVHYILAVAYVAFLMLHVYMTTTGKHVRSMIKGMITGHHYE